MGSRVRRLRVPPMGPSPPPLLVLQQQQQQHFQQLAGNLIWTQKEPVGAC